MKNKFSKIAKTSIMLLFCLCFTFSTFAEKRYYLVADGTLPTDGVDYRLGTSRTLDITASWDWGYPAGTLAQTSTHSSVGITGANYLDFNISTWWWWRFSFLTSTTTDFRDVDNTCKLHLGIKTTETGENITITLYGATAGGVQTEGSYVLNYTSLPLSARDGSWHEFDIPMSAFFGQANPLDFTAAVSTKFFSVAGGGSQNTTIALDNVYITGTGVYPVVPDANALVVPTGGITLSANNAYTNITFTDNTSKLTLADGVIITADILTVPVAVDGSAPQIALGSNARITTAKYVVEKKVASDKWSILSVPFDYSTSSIILKSTGSAAVPTTDLTMYSNNPNVFGSKYAGSPAVNMWQEITTATTIRTVTPRDPSHYHAIALKMDATKYPTEETLVITGNNVVISGTNVTIGTAWGGSGMNGENFNFTGTPFTKDYTGVIASSGSNAGGRIAPLGMTTYTYNRITDNYTTNVPCQGPATYRAYDAFFCQAYENTQAPFIPVLSTPATYNVLNQYQIGIDNLDNVKIIESTTANINFIQNEDGVKLFGMSPTTSAIYALDANNIKMSVSATPTIPAEIKLGINSGIASSHTISVINPISNKVYTLKDNVTSTETNISNTPYTFTTTTTGPIDTRFVLKITNDGTTRIDEALSNPSNVRFNGNLLHIDNLPKNAKVRIIGINGSVISTDMVTGNSFDKNMNLSRGVYLVEITGDSSPKSVTKIIK